MRLSALTALALRGRPSPLTLTVAGGSLRLPPDTLARTIAERLAADPDVVSTRSRMVVRDARIVADIWVAVRPLAPREPLEAELREAATSALRAELGLAADVRRLYVKVLRVRELPRYLNT